MAINWNKGWEWADRAYKIALICGTLIGGLATYEYVLSNRIIAGGELLKFDRQMSEVIRNKPYRSTIYAQPRKQGDIVKNLDDLMKLSLEQNTKRTFTFKNVPDLHEKLFEYDKFNSSDRARFRDMLLVFEDILANIEAAYICRHEGFVVHIISQDELDTWTNELYDIGRHPLFLAAIYDVHKYGYSDDKFLEWLRRQMKKSPDISNVLSAVYPEMLKEDWAKQGGKGAGKGIRE